MYSAGRHSTRGPCQGLADTVHVPRGGVPTESDRGALVQEDDLPAAGVTTGGTTGYIGVRVLYMREDIHVQVRSSVFAAIIQHVRVALSVSSQLFAPLRTKPTSYAIYNASNE